MMNEIYEAPQVEVIEIEVEKGFAQSYTVEESAFYLETGEDF